MSEISITRFQPALKTKGQVKSVESADNDLDANQSHNPLREKNQGQGQGGGQQGRQDQQSKKQQTPSEQRQDAQVARSAGAPTGGDESSDKVRGKAVRSAEPTDDPVMQDALEKAVTRLNDYVQHVKRDLIFDIDPESQEPSVTVVDRESRQVLRHFDSHETLELAKKLDAEEPISLFKTKV